jgi:hypothetical protein
MKEQFAQMMLDEKLDFLPLKESLQLLESGIKIDTQFSWVVHSEELEDNGYGMSVEEILEAHADIYGESNKDYLKVGNSYDEFDEFTLELCPAPTYTDLIR